MFDFSAHKQYYWSMQLIYLQVIYDSIIYTLKFLNLQEGLETFHRHENNKQLDENLDSVESATIMLIIINV